MVAIRMTNDFDEMVDHAVDVTSRNCLQTLRSRGWTQEQISVASGAMLEIINTIADGLSTVMRNRIISARKVGCGHMAAFAVAVPLLIAGKMLIDSVGREENH